MRRLINDYSLPDVPPDNIKTGGRHPAETGYKPCAQCVIGENISVITLFNGYITVPREPIIQEYNSEYQQ